MSNAVVAAEARFVAAVQVGASRLASRGRERLDAAIVRYDAWFLVLIAVLLALGAILVIGAAVWCLTKANGRKFTGGVKAGKSGFSVYIECV